MTSIVRVVRALDFDRERIEFLLGEKALCLEHVEAPSILVDGIYRTSASRWLRRKHALRPVESAISTYAYRLAGYIAYLRNERGLIGTSEWSSDGFAVTSDDLRALYRSRQFEDATRVSSVSWRGVVVLGQRKLGLENDRAG
ncbi:hypothetical protein [Ferrimicrobium sp.]|uniref:hypothetical protein n=1 Tax=Ferrimicrobium sp. TaxID=2926050 RepID=UPI0026289275|nr:hypothetical protein [Ferrimicrobium sp.]